MHPQNLYLNSICYSNLMIHSWIGPILSQISEFNSLNDWSIHTWFNLVYCNQIIQSVSWTLNLKRIIPFHEWFVMNRMKYNLWINSTGKFPIHKNEISFSSKSVLNSSCKSDWTIHEMCLEMCQNFIENKQMWYKKCCLQKCCSGFAKPYLFCFCG